MPTQCQPHHLLVKKKISSLKASHIGNMVFFYIYMCTLMVKKRLQKLIVF